MVEKVLDVGIDGKGPFDSAHEIATRALKKHPKPDDAVDAIVKSHLKLAAGSGFVTSLGGFITLPVALPANVAGFYVLATRMVAAIAKVRGHDLSRPQVRSAVLLTLVGADADDLLAKAGMVAPTGRLTALAAGASPRAGRLWWSTRPWASGCSPARGSRSSVGSGGMCRSSGAWWGPGSTASSCTGSPRTRVVSSTVDRRRR